MSTGYTVLFQEIAHARPTLKALETSAGFKSITRDMLLNKSHCVSVFDTKKSLLALAALSIYPQEARIHIDFLEVAAPHRRKGLARKLYEEIFKRASQLSEQTDRRPSVTGDRFTDDGKKVLMPLKARIQAEQYPDVNAYQIPGGA